MTISRPGRCGRSWRTGRRCPGRHQQPQRLSFAVGTELGRCGRASTCGPPGQRQSDRSSGSALANVEAADDLLDLLPGRSDSGPGPARNGWNLPLPRPAAAPPADGPRPRPAHTLPGGGDLKLRDHPAACIADRPGMGVQMSIDPETWSAPLVSLTFSSFMRSWNGGTGLEGNSRGNPVMSHGPTAGQAPDQAGEGGQAGAGSTGDKSLERHVRRTVGHVTSHPAPPTPTLACRARRQSPEPRTHTHWHDRGRRHWKGAGLSVGPSL